MTAGMTAAMTALRPLVSVLVPLHNHARYIEACLESIWRDDYPEIEVVVLDDGSTDGSLETVRRWRDRRPGRFREFRLLSQGNRGITRTLNRLVTLARGDFVTLLASDDLLLGGGIATRVAALERHPQWLGVFADSIVVDGEGRHVHESGLEYLGADRRALRDRRLRTPELLLNWAVPGPVFMARRRAYDPERGVGLYDESLSIEDKDFYLRLLARKALGFVDAAVAAYRVHGDNTVLESSRRDRCFESLWRTDAKHAGSFGLAWRFVLGLSALRHRLSIDRPRTLLLRLERKLVGTLWDGLVRLHARRVRRLLR